VQRGRGQASAAAGDAACYNLRSRKAMSAWISEICHA